MRRQGESWKSPVGKQSWLLSWNRKSGRGHSPSTKRTCVVAALLSARLLQRVKGGVMQRQPPAGQRRRALPVRAYQQPRQLHAITDACFSRSEYHAMTD